MVVAEAGESTPFGNNGDSSSSSSRCGRICSRFMTFLHFLNTFCVAILAAAVIVLGLQLQYVFYQLQYVVYPRLNEDQQEVAYLKNSIQNQTQGQIQQLSEKVDQEHSLTIYHMAGTFTLLTCLVTMFHMSIHLRNYREPDVQRKIVAILWMSPIYALTSFLSLIMPVVEGYLAVIKDFYEAYVIYTFLSFLIAVLGRGDREVAVQVLSQHADHLKQPTRCLSNCYHPPPEASATAKANAVLLECQILAMQFVLVRPLTSIANFIGFALSGNEHQYDDEETETDNWSYFRSPSFFIAMVTNVSVFFAFAGLMKFYHAVAEDLVWCQPFPKFMAIKGIVFLTFWQGLVISIVVSFHGGGDWALEDDKGRDSPREKATAIQNVLICLEMLFFSIAHWCVFPAEEWEEGYRPRKIAKPGIGLRDFASDMKMIVTSAKDARARRREGNAELVPSMDEEEENAEALPQLDSGKLA